MKIFLLALILSQSAFTASEVEIGGRIHAIASESNVDEISNQDFSLRRIRVNLKYILNENQQIGFDIRNDDSNAKNKGEGKFNIGDAYWRIFSPHENIGYAQFFRGKADVSYSQTSSSNDLFKPNRTIVSEYASDYVIHNRRAPNAQINGNFDNLAFHLIISDGIYHEDLQDLAGNSASTIIGQKFTTGAKIRYFFIGDASKNIVKETFYGEQDTFSLGFGYFHNDKITYEYAGTQNNISRSLNNAELSFAKNNFRLLVEWFEFFGDVKNLVTNDIGKSNGYYGQIEFIWNKFAPYIITEEFNRDPSAKDYIYKSSGIGINYYLKNEEKRFGISYQVVEENENLDIQHANETSIYAMINF